MKAEKRTIVHNSEFQRLHPEISPPKKRDRCHREISPVNPPKFVRDSISVSDIEGAQVINKRKQLKTRDIMKYRDIEGACPRKEHWNYKNYAFDDYSDVTKPKKRGLFLEDRFKNKNISHYKRLLKGHLQRLKNSRNSHHNSVILKVKF